jgi:uncharacterized protein DUF4388
MESKTQSILTVLAALSARGVTGTLRFELEPGSGMAVEFLFREGKLVFATSNQPGERLAEFLVRRGLFSGEQARALLIEARRKGKMFHAHLAEREIVPHDLLQDLLYQRTEELVDVILKSEAGQVVFQPQPLSQLDNEVPGVDAELFGRLLKHRQVWPRLFQEFRDPNLVLRPRPDIEGAMASMSPSEQKLLSVLDGQRPVSKILERRKNRIDLMILLARFLDSGLVEPVPAEVEAAEPSLAPASTAPVPAEPKEEAQPAGPPAAPPPTAAVQQAPAAARQDPLPALPPPAAPPPEAAAVQPVPAEPAPKEEEPSLPPIDFDLVPVLSSGMDLASMSITGLMMDDLFLISQIDGKSTVRELTWITRMPEEKVRGVLGRMLQHGYVRLQTRMGGMSGMKRFLPQPSVPAAASEPRPESPAPAADKAPAEAPQSFQYSYNQALTAYNEQKYGDAERHLRRALSMQPRSALVRARLAMTLLERSGQERSAEKLAEEAFEEDPLLGQCLEALGLVRLRSGDYVEARRLLDKAVFLDKQHVPASVRILYELKSHPPQKGDSPDDFWWRVHRLIKLTA